VSNQTGNRSAGDADERGVTESFPVNDYGEADDASDIDLLVSFEPTTSLVQHAALIRELREFLGCPVDVVDDEGLRPRMRDRILNEAIPL
jgi:predicted nucleotidyltransferase